MWTGEVAGSIMPPTRRGGGCRRAGVQQGARGIIVPGVQLDGEAARAAAEGQAALDAGDTQRARERFRDAGAAVEARVGQLVKQPAKQLARFAAAAQYHRGGHYRKALELAQRVEARFLGPQE